MAFSFCAACGQLLRDSQATCGHCGTGPPPRGRRSLQEIADELAAVDAELRKVRPQQRSTGLTPALVEDDPGYACPECLHWIRPHEMRCPLCLVCVGASWRGLSESGKLQWAREVLRRDFPHCERSDGDELAVLRAAHRQLTRQQFDLLVARRQV
jgi:RNA polymerase subunit RPABC4/transcription elongation factor Spt4